LGADLVQRLQGSIPAKQRLEAILQTLTGHLTIPQACAQLGINASRFHALRTEALQQVLLDLEPRLPGRPRQVVGAEQARIGELERQVQDLKIELRAAQIRQEMALLMPHLLHRRRRADARAAEGASGGAPGGASGGGGKKLARTRPRKRPGPGKPAGSTRPTPCPRPATDP
jgi:hypothetical protein